MLYVAGIGRSGSTIVGGALGQMRGHLGVGEVMRFLERGLLRNEPCSCDRLVHTCSFWGPIVQGLGGDRVQAAEDLPDLVRDVRRVTEGRLAPRALLRPSALPDRLRRFLGELYGRIGERADGRVLVDTSKNPVWLKLLLEVPGVDVHVLHLIRDSRDVARSYLKRRTRNGGDEDVYMYRTPALVTALGWNVVNLLTRRIGRHAKSYRIVRYEDFARRPVRVLQTQATGKNPAAEPVPRGARHPPSIGTNRPGEDLYVHFRKQHLVAGNPVRLEATRVRVASDGHGNEGLSPITRAAVTLATAPGLARYGYPVIAR